MDTDAQQYEHRTERDRSAALDEGQGVRRRSVRAVPVRASGATRVFRPRVLLATVVVIPAVVMLAGAFVVEPFRVAGGSMAPTLRAGDRVLVNKLTYRFGNHPERGDVVVFDGRGSLVAEDQAGGDYVKRVIGVGGDRVRCCDVRGRVEVNGVPVEEDYLRRGALPSSVPFDIRVPERRLWVMGDHRADSEDSRDHLGSPGGGTVPVDRVVGRVDWIGWPHGRWSSVGAHAYGGAHAHGGRDMAETGRHG